MRKHYDGSTLLRFNSEICGAGTISADMLREDGHSCANPYPAPPRGKRSSESQEGGRPGRHLAWSYYVWRQGRRLLLERGDEASMSRAVARIAPALNLYLG